MSPKFNITFNVSVFSTILEVTPQGGQRHVIGIPDSVRLLCPFSIHFVAAKGVKLGHHHDPDVLLQEPPDKDCLITAGAQEVRVRGRQVMRDQNLAGVPPPYPTIEIHPTNMKAPHLAQTMSPGPKARVSASPTLSSSSASEAPPSSTVAPTALLGNNGISIIIKLSMPLKCRIFNVEYLRQYLR